MASTMETALAALAATLDAATAAEVIRNADRPENVGHYGLVIQRDGAQTDAEATFSPLRYHVEHTAEVVVFAPDEASRATLAATLAAALIADRTLGGAVEFLEVSPASLDDADFDGAPGIPGLSMPVVLSYTVLGSPLA